LLRSDDKKKRKRNADRRVLHSAPAGAAPPLRRGLAYRRSTAVLATGSFSSPWLSVRPGFLGRGLHGCCPASPVPVQYGTSRSGHSAGGHDARAARERGVWPPAGTALAPPSESTLPAGVRSLGEMVGYVIGVGTHVKDMVAIIMTGASQSDHTPYDARPPSACSEIEVGWRSVDVRFSPEGCRVGLPQSRQLRATNRFPHCGKTTAFFCQLGRCNVSDFARSSTLRAYIGRRMPLGAGKPALPTAKI
jgi:hypothetical protein